MGASIFHLEKYRKPVFPQAKIFHLTSNPEFSSHIQIYLGLKVVPILNASDLELLCLEGMPDLFLMDDDIQWGEPLDLIEVIHSRWNIPQVMLLKSKKKMWWKKKAFSLGIQDTILYPEEKSDLAKAVQLFLRMKVAIPTAEILGH